MFDQITGLVLAGGQSSRMGTNKALLEYQSETLLDRAQRLIKFAGCKEVLISGDYYGYRCVRDNEQLGPLSGVLAGLEACQTDKLLILPVDMPCMSVDLLQLLCTLRFDSPGVCYADQPFPLLLRRTPETIALLHQILSPETPAKERSLFRFIRLGKITTLPVSPKYNYCFENSNTPEEWNVCQRHLCELSKGL